MKCTILFFLCGIYSCGQRTTEIKIETVQLSNKIIPLVNHLDNPDSGKLALSFLDSATKIDSNCFMCYYNKLMFSNSLKQFRRSIEAINECIRIKPTAHELYLTGGVLYDKVGDPYPLQCISENRW